MSDENRESDDESERQEEESTSLPAREAEEESEPENEFICATCGKPFKSQFALLGHQKRHKGEEKRGLSQAQEEIARLREGLQREETARKLAEEQVKKLRASRELSAMQAQGTIDPVDAAITRLVKLRELEALRGPSETLHVQSQGNGEDSAISRRLETLERELAQERQDRQRREQDEALKQSIINEVNLRLQDLNSELKQHAQSSPKSDNVISSALNNMTTVISKSQDNLSALLRSFFAAPPTPVPGVSKNPQVEILKQLGLVDYPERSKAESVPQ